MSYKLFIEQLIRHDIIKAEKKDDKNYVRNRSHRIRKKLEKAKKTRLNGSSETITLFKKAVPPLHVAHP